MVKSNAERQAEYQRRLKQRLAQSVTPDDVRKAVRLIYDEYASEPLNRAPPFEDWLAKLKGNKGREQWAGMVPDTLDPDAYEDFAPDDAALCLKVAAVARAMRQPPGD